MNILFNARIDAFIPGNFISWRIIKIPGQKTPAIEENYDLDGIDVVTRSISLNVIPAPGIGFMPRIPNYDRLKNAVFEIRKTDRKRFTVVRYVGEMKVEYKIEPGANTEVLEVSHDHTHARDTEPEPAKKTFDRFGAID